MFKNVSMLIFLLIFGVAWLIPPDENIWKSFLSEYLTFLSGLFLILCIGFKNLKIPKIILPILIVSFIPLIHYWIGFSFSYTFALLNFFYLIAFFIFIIFSYNFSVLYKNNLMLNLSYCLVAISTVSSVFSIIQWLGLSTFLPVVELIGNRPYANLGQPNLLATMLLVGVLACLYLYEKNKVSPIILTLISMFIIFSVSLTQSRTSWIVVIFIIFYILLKRKNIELRIGFNRLLYWCSYFIVASFLLPYLGKVIYLLFNVNSIDITSVAQRATSQYERLSLWTQNIYAICEQPWLGYGWYQTGVSQMYAMDKYHFSPWYVSAHNIFIDIILWNGIIIGGLIILFFSYLLFKLNAVAKTTESFIAVLMMVPILIHAMLEFPLFYANFIFLFALLVGITLSDADKLKSIKLSKFFIIPILLLYFLTLTLSWREYVSGMSDFSRARIIAINKIADHKLGNFKKYDYIADVNYLLFKDFDLHARWLVLDVKDKISDSDIKKYREFVLLNPSEFNLFKYAQILAFNDRKDMAVKQLWYIRELYGNNYDYDYLLKTLK
ncbi:Wzy polymerase domain-containing protein [Acinetobacter bereziniae]|uniref:PglL family O-oligosaccharyltransferase n=1 Tax=Acinetobacter bereziniae TaxID=106648 RepID=UPI0032152974